MHRVKFKTTRNCERRPFAATLAEWPATYLICCNFWGSLTLSLSRIILHVVLCSLPCQAACCKAKT